MDPATVLLGMLVGVVAVVHVAACVHIAKRMRQVGRSGRRWFVLSLLVTVGPAWFVLVRRARRTAQGGGMRRCVRCGRMFSPEEAAASDGLCPRCGLRTNETHLA